MKMKKIGTRAIILLIVITMTACKTGTVKQVDPNYMQALNAHNQALIANAQMVTALANGCKTSTESDASAWCTSLIASMVTGNKGLNTGKVPTHVEKKTKGDILLSKTLDIVGRALPIVGNVIISKDNNKANVKIQESRDAMLTGIVTSGFTGMTTLGSRDSISVGGDYTNGDGNTTGDGNIFAGDGAVIGDENLVGDGNVTGDGNQSTDGDGNVFGDGNTTGDGNRVGDGNVEGDSNALGNDVGGDLFLGDGNGDNNGDNNGDDNSTDVLPPNTP